MKLLPWLGLAGLLYFMLKPEEAEAAPPSAGPDLSGGLLQPSPFLAGKTVGIAPIPNPCFSRVRRRAGPAQLDQVYSA